MKILFLLMILFLVSCGPKSESTKAKFRIFSGHSAVEARAIFPGGILIMGKNSEGDQSFILPYQDDLVLTLKKGNWNLAAIGWMGPKPMTGSQKCGYVSVEVRADSLDVPFSMNHAACGVTYNSPIFERNAGYFTDPRFYFSASYLGGHKGFKKLKVISSTSSSPPYTYYKIKIPIHLEGGVLTNQALSDGLSSECYASTAAADAATPPHGGADGFIGVNILTFSESSCVTSSSRGIVFFPHGTGAGACWKNTSGSGPGMNCPPYSTTTDTTTTTTTTTSGNNYSAEFSTNSADEFATLTLTP